MYSARETSSMAQILTAATCFIRLAETVPTTAVTLRLAQGKHPSGMRATWSGHHKRREHFQGYRCQPGSALLPGEIYTVTGSDPVERMLKICDAAQRGQAAAKAVGMRQG